MTPQPESVDRPRIDDGLRLPVGAQHDQEIADHRSFALVVEFYLAGLLQQVQRRRVVEREPRWG